MVEQLQTPEIKKKGAPTNIIYGAHGDKHIANLQCLDNTIGNILKAKSSGNVVVFIEDANATDSTAEKIEQMVESGKSPSESFGVAFFDQIYHRTPNLNDRYDLDEVTNIISEQTRFRIERLNILNKHIKATGRIKLLYEARPNDQTEIGNIFIDEYDAAMNVAAFCVTHGNFNQGLKLFKKATEDIARECNEREDRLAPRISTVAQNKDVAGIVAYIGAVHTRLGHILSKGESTVTRTFPEKEQGKFIYDTASEAMRKLQFSPDKEIPEDEWYRLMIGATMYGMLSLHYKQQEAITGNKVSDQQIIKLSRAYLKGLGLTDIKSIQLFEKGVRQNGFTKELNRKISS